MSSDKHRIGRHSVRNAGSYTERAVAPPCEGASVLLGAWLEGCLSMLSLAGVAFGELLRVEIHIFFLTAAGG